MSRVLCWRLAVGRILREKTELVTKWSQQRRTGVRMGRKNKEKMQFKKGKVKQYIH